METTTTPMSNDEIVENLKTMVFGVQAYKRFNAKERETLDKAWNLIDQYENRLKADMMAMLKEIDLQFDEICFYKKGEWKTVPEIKAEYKAVIQERINSLKEIKDDK